MITTEDTTIADEAIANIGSTDLIDDDLKAIVTFIIRETDGFYVDLKRAPLGGIMAFLAGREPSKFVPVFGISRAATGQFTMKSEPPSATGAARLPSGLCPTNSGPGTCPLRTWTAFGTICTAAPVSPHGAAFPMVGEAAQGESGLAEVRAMAEEQASQVVERLCTAGILEGDPKEAVIGPDGIVNDHAAA